MIVVNVVADRVDVKVFVLLLLLFARSTLLVLSLLLIILLFTTLLLLLFELVLANGGAIFEGKLFARIGITPDILSPKGPLTMDENELETGVKTVLTEGDLIIPQLVVVIELFEILFRFEATEVTIEALMTLAGIRGL